MKKIILLSALSLFVFTLSFADTNRDALEPGSSILQNPPHAEYVIDVSDETGSPRQNIVTEESHVGKMFKIAKVHRSEGKILLTVGRYSKGYQMKIEDRYGKIIYEEQQHLGGDFAQVYDISSIRGKFTVTVADENGNEEKFEF